MDKQLSAYTLYSDKKLSAYTLYADEANPYFKAFLQNSEEKPEKLVGRKGGTLGILSIDYVVLLIRQRQRQR